MRLRIAVVLAALFVIGLMASPVHAQTVPTCFGRQATIVGTPGDDVLRGSAGTDVIVGLGGNDVLGGNFGYQDGDDFLCGNGGNDGIEPSSGDDHLSGGGGRDFIDDWLGNDVIDGGTGVDTVGFEGIGPDSAVYADLRSGSATGQVIGEDLLSGIENLSTNGDGGVVFIGDSGPNRLQGGESNDVLRGMGGDDLLEAEAESSDRLNGGTGEDTCKVRPPEVAHDVWKNCEHVIFWVA